MSFAIRRGVFSLVSLVPKQIHSGLFVTKAHSAIFTHYRNVNSQTAKADLARVESSFHEFKNSGAPQEDVDELASLVSSLRNTTEKIQKLEGMESCENLDMESLTKFTDAKTQSEINELVKAMQECDEILKPKGNAPEIDFDAYRTKLLDPSLVDEIQNFQKTIKLPDFHAEYTKKIADYNQKMKPCFDEVDKLAKESEAALAEAEDEYQMILHLQNNIKDMSVEQFLAKYPKIKEQVEKDLKDEKWFQVLE